MSYTTLHHPPYNTLHYIIIMDMKMKMGNDNKVVYKFFKKPMANKFTMMAHSAVSDKVKRSTMTNDALRRLLCCSPNLDDTTKKEVMEEYARTLRRSGYPERFRHEVISDAVRGHNKMIQAETEGGRPVDRPREYQEKERKKVKADKRERYYRSERSWGQQCQGGAEEDTARGRNAFPAILVRRESAGEQGLGMRLTATFATMTPQL